MFALLYHSRATADLSQAHLDAIAADARARNALWNITGALLCVPHGPDRGFAQWIEGDEEAVLSLFALIERNDLHRACTLVEIQEETVGGARHFSASDMVGIQVPRLPTTAEAFLAAATSSASAVYPSEDSTE